MTECRTARSRAASGLANTLDDAEDVWEDDEDEAAAVKKAAAKKAPAKKPAAKKAPAKKAPAKKPDTK